MSDACPDPSLLAAWADGAIGDNPSADAIERHLADCPRCGHSLETRTRSQLASLHLDRLRSGAPDTEGASTKLVQRLIRAALSGAPIPAGDPLPGFLAGLEPSNRPGSLGRFADYEIEESIGRGGMGVVFRAFDLTLQRQVALKVLLHEDRTTADEAAAERFLHEARAIAALRHEHIVEIYSAGRGNGWPFLVMPFHREGTLQQWLDAGKPVTPDDVARIGIQLLRALKITHGQGILHRDLKPSNVLLERGLAQVKLADFGLAQSTTSVALGAGPVVAGTPDYMSPEQARGDPLDARSDLFGLGALLYHLQTGHPPRRSSASEAAGPAPAPLREIPSPLRPVLQRLLAPRAADRFPDATAALQVLEAQFQPSQPRANRGRRFRFLAISAGVLVASLALLAGLELSGRTVFLNSLLCEIRGHGFFLQGRIGTHAHLAQASAACRPGEVVVARFDGEKPTQPFRVGTEGLRLCAAPGFHPVLATTNNHEPLILARGPLLLEGVALVSRSDTRDGGQLIAAEGVPIRLVNCRLLRLRASGDDQLVRTGRRLDPDAPQLTHKPLVLLRSGSSAEIRRTMVIGLAATAIGLQGSGPEDIRVQSDQSLFVVHRTFVIRPESKTRVVLDLRNSALASAAMIDIENASALDQLAVSWSGCLLDPTGGVLLRWARGGDGSWITRLTWTETNVVYAGSGNFAFERRRGAIASASEWNDFVRLSPGSHRRSSRPLFGEIRTRASHQLEAIDVDVRGLANDTGLEPTFRPEFVGAGAAYDRFRREPGYSGATAVDPAASPTRRR